MESGNSNNLNSEPQIEHNHTDWRNYRSNPQNTSKAPEPVAGTPRKRDGNGTAIGLAVFALLIALTGCAFGGFAFYKSITQPTVVSTTSAEGYYTGNSAEFKETSIAGIVSKVTPAVVSIISQGYSSGSIYGIGGATSSAGTGMIVSSDGYVITNKHVVDGSRNIRIITDAGDTYTDVKLLGVDPLNDVAYLKINGAKNLPTITLGDSKTIAVGQPVLAIGNALGAYQNSVTQGIIGGTGRTLEAGDSTGKNVEYLTDMLQTDAAINPGNSGGPLVNAAGDVIGINTATSATAEGLGFAIPISAVKGMLKRIMDDGKAERAYLGLAYTTITADVAKQYKLPVKQGAYIFADNARGSAIIKGGPADKAGIKDKDIVTKIGEVEVGRAGSISTLVGEYKVGDTIAITLMRDGKTMTVNVTLEAYKE